MSSSEVTQSRYTSYSSLVVLKIWVDDADGLFMRLG